MRDSFVLYESYIDALRALPPEQFKTALLALADYALHGVMPEEPYLIAMVGMAKFQIDKNNARYDSSVENGKKGGRPKNTTEPSETQENPDKPNETQNNPTEPSETLYVYDNDTVSVSDNDYVNDKKENSLIGINESTRRRVVEAWNSLEPLGITPVRAITAASKRSQMLNARLRQYGEDVIVDSIASVKDQPFLHGQAWFTFDWFIKPNNFIKVYDGNYKDKQHSGRVSEVDRWV